MEPLVVEEVIVVAEVIAAAEAVEVVVIQLEDQAALNVVKKVTFQENVPTNLPEVAVWEAIANVSNVANRVTFLGNVPKVAVINVSVVKKKDILAEIALKVVEITVLIVVNLVTCQEIALKKSK